MYDNPDEEEMAVEEAPAEEPFNEEDFQDWFRSWADTTGLDADPDDPRHFYDYRAAYTAGDEPEYNEADGAYHWPSQHKADDHPNRFVNGMDTKYDKPQYPDPDEADPVETPEEDAQEPDPTDPGTWEPIPIKATPTTEPGAPGEVGPAGGVGPIGATEQPAAEQPPAEKTFAQKALDAVGTVLSPGKAEAAPDPNDPNTWEIIPIAPKGKPSAAVDESKDWEPIKILTEEERDIRNAEAAKKATGRDFWGNTEEENKKKEAEDFEKQRRANAIAQPIIRRWTDNHPIFGELPNYVKNSDWWNDAVSGAAMDAGGMLWEQRRLLMLQGKDLPPEALKMLKAFDQMQGYNSQKTGASSFIPAAAEILGQQVNSALSEEANPYMAGMAAALAAGATAIYLSPVFGPAAPAAVLAAATAAGGAAMKAVMFNHAKAVEGGQAFSELLQTKDRDGKLVDPKVAAVAAGIIGDINGVLELVGFEAVMRMIPGLKEVGKQGIRTFVKSNEVLRHKLFEIARGYAIGVVGETGTEALQELPAIVTDAIIKDKSVLGSVFSKETYDKLTDIVEKVGKGMMVLGVFGAGAKVPGALRAEKEQQTRTEIATEIVGKQADFIQEGLSTNDATRPQVEALLEKYKKEWPDNPIIQRLEAMLEKTPDSAAAGPSMYSPGTTEDLDTLRNYIKTNMPDAGEFGIEAAPERSGMGTIQRMADATGSKVVFFKGTEAAWQLNGLYDSDSNTIFIHEDAENPYAVVLGHETLHQLKTQHADLYGNLSSALLEGNIGFEAYLENLNTKRAKAKLPALTIEDAAAREEFVADFVGEQFQNPEFWAKVNAKNPKLGQRLAQYVSDLLEKMRSAIMGKEFSGLKQRQQREFTDRLDAVQDALASTYVEFSRRNKKVQDQTTTTVGGAIATALTPGSAEAKTTAGKVASVKFMITKQDEARLKDLGYGQDQINAMTPEVAGSILANNIAPPEAAKAKIIEPDITDESTWEVIDLVDEVKPEEEIIDLVDEVKPAETKQQEFNRLWESLTKEQKRHLDFSVDDTELSIDEKLTFVKAEMAVKREAPPGIAPAEKTEPKAPVKAKKARPVRPSKITTLRGRIIKMGKINPGNMKGEFRDAPLETKFIFKKSGTPLDLAEITLRDEGWIGENENLVDVLRDPQNLRRNKVAGEGVAKRLEDMTEQEKEVAAALEWEPEAPPEGEFVTLKAEDLPEGETLTIIDDSARGWDLYEVIDKTSVTITLQDGQTIELKPGDIVQVLKGDLPSPRLINFKKDVADYRKKNEGKVFVAEELSDAWDYVKEQIQSGKGTPWLALPGLRLSRERFEAIADKIESDQKLDSQEFNDFMRVISYMEKLNEADPEFSKTVAAQETETDITKRGFEPVPKGMISADIPEGAIVLINGKEYKNNGWKDGFIEIQAIDSKETVTLEAFDEAGIEGIKGGKAPTLSLRDKNMEIDVVAMDEAGNTALVKEKAGVAVAENRRQIEFAKRLLECLNS